MTAGHFKPHMLTWARKRCGFSTDDMAHKLGVDIQHVLAWEAGSIEPNTANAQKFADRTHIPLTYLLLAQPPKRPMPVADFRYGWKQYSNPEEEVNLKELVHKIIAKKEWLEEYLDAQDTEPKCVAFQGKFDENADYREVAANIAGHIGPPIQDASKNRGGSATFWRKFSERVIDANIWLMQTSIVDSDTTRKVSPKTCCGLALKSRHCPVVWVNSALAFAPRVFTLARELAHLWVGCEGVSNKDEDIDGKFGIEKLGDMVAAELLVPEATLTSLWDRKRGPRINVEKLHHHFGVSRFAVAQKSAHAGLIGDDEYINLKEALGKTTQSRSGSRKLSKEGEKSFYPELLARNGAYFIETVADELDHLNLLWKEGMWLLGVKSSDTINGASDYLIGPDVEISNWA